MYIINGKGSVIRIIGGSFVLASILLSIFVHQYWLILAGLVGTFLILSGLTGFCLMEIILKSLGVEERVTVKKQ